MQICRTMTTPAPVSDVFAYLADFTTTTEWDPGTVSTTLVSGDGSIRDSTRTCRRSGAARLG